MRTTLIVVDLQNGFMAPGQPAEVAQARDIVPNVNFFMRVPVERGGDAAIARGDSAPGSYVELEAMMDAIVAISNCPQINNPCNDYNPTPIRVVISE